MTSSGVGPDGGCELRWNNPIYHLLLHPDHSAAWQIHLWLVRGVIAVNVVLTVLWLLLSLRLPMQHNAVLAIGHLMTLIAVPLIPAVYASVLVWGQSNAEGQELVRLTTLSSYKMVYGYFQGAHERLKQPLRRIELVLAVLAILRIIGAAVISGQIDVMLWLIALALLAPLIWYIEAVNDLAVAVGVWSAFRLRRFPIAAVILSFMLFALPALAIWVLVLGLSYQSNPADVQQICLCMGFVLMNIVFFVFVTSQLFPRAALSGARKWVYPKRDKP
jgi:hypothetical protein